MNVYPRFENKDIVYYIGETPQSSQKLIYVQFRYSADVVSRRRIGNLITPALYGALNDKTAEMPTVEGQRYPKDFLPGWSLDADLALDIKSTKLVGPKRQIATLYIEPRHPDFMPLGVHIRELKRVTLAAGEAVCEGLQRHARESLLFRWRDYGKTLLEHAKSSRQLAWGTRPPSPENTGPR